MAYDGSQSGYSNLFNKMGPIEPTVLMSPVSSSDRPYDDMSLAGETMAASVDGRSTISPDGDEAADPLIAASRAYQLEMFEESMRRNIIVAMDTGTGKTRM